MTQKPVNAKISKFTPTSAVKINHNGLTNHASNALDSVNVPATNQMRRSRYHESVFAMYTAEPPNFPN